VNRVMISGKTAGCKRCARARAWQAAILQKLRKNYPHYRTFLAPELPLEIAGKTALKKFTAELWQIAE